MQPQDAPPQQQMIGQVAPAAAAGQQIMGQVAPAAAMGQQVIIVQNRSGGPKVFGIIAIILGGLGALAGLMTFGTDTAGFGGTAKLVVYLTATMNVASSGLFLYAGILLMGYQRKGVWVGFGAVGIAVLSTIINVMIVAKETADVFGEDAAGFVAGFGFIWAGIQAVCCSLIIALPLLMNGADLE